MRLLLGMIVICSLLVACGEAESAKDQAGARPGSAATSEDTTVISRDEIGGLDVTSDPAPAFVFVDGQFMGETAQGRPLQIIRRSGPVHLRVACPHHGDGIYRLEIPRGEILELRAGLTKDPTSWDYPDHDVPIGPGQELRGVILPKDGEVKVIRYSETIAEPLERVVCIVKGNPELRVLGPAGEVIEMDPMPEGIEGAPGNRFFRLQFEKPGAYVLEVGGRPGPYSLRWMNGIPPLSGSEEPYLKKRRKAPESFGPK